MAINSNPADFLVLIRLPNWIRIRIGSIVDNSFYFWPHKERENGGEGEVVNKEQGIQFFTLVFLGVGGHVSPPPPPAVKIRKKKLPYTL